jgi:hypothetical protein
MSFKCMANSFPAGYVKLVAGAQKHEWEKCMTSQRTSRLWSAIGMLNALSDAHLFFSKVAMNAIIPQGLNSRNFTSARVSEMVRDLLLERLEFQCVCSCWSILAAAAPIILFRDIRCLLSKLSE